MTVCAKPTGLISRSPSSSSHLWPLLGRAINALSDHCRRVAGMSVAVSIFFRQSSLIPRQVKRSRDAFRDWEMWGWNPGSLSPSNLIAKGANMSVRATKPGQERTPLHCAVTEGHADLAQLLISKGADVNVADE